jgi:cytochrome c oxidase cbb3-type subunit 1
MGYQLWEYELEWPIDVLLGIVWIAYASVFFRHVVSAKE